MRRLPPQPGERLDRRRPLTFSFDGRPVVGFDGDTIASALLASGRDVLSRSFKYHRPRGLMCCAGQCPNCIVSVDGAPGARACTEQVREGMQVEHVNAVPSLEFDAMLRRKFKDKALAHDRRDQNHFHQREALPDADAPAAAERQICRARPVLGGL